MALVVKQVGRQPTVWMKTKSGGDLGGLGEPYYALIDDALGEVAFAPPNSCALQREGGEVVSWRCDLKPGTTGACREDYRWTVEIYSWPDQALQFQYVVQDQEGCVHRISFLEKTERRIVRLGYAQEDFRACGRRASVH